ncbi:unnamed protein product [Anisakis simplex]|uniref:Transmembrane protein 98 n=1 Tax=Anisakis simplex TaxID=6269 RepID=A0A158PNB3_ANISI|nr:unnamed protein product [Anisakis simplex]
MCKRRSITPQQYFCRNGNDKSNLLRFSKLRNANMDSIIQLSPLIVIEKLSSAVPLLPINPQLNDYIVRSTNRLMPQFDDLIRAMASDQVDIRILEARASSLVSACWALASPFTMVNCKNIEIIDGALREMDNHVESLRLVIKQAEQRIVEQETLVNNSSHSNSPLKTIIEETSLNEQTISPPSEPLITQSLTSNDEAPADPGNN